MAEHDEFFALLKEVKETWDSIAVLLEKFGWDFFSEAGAVKAQAYEILDDAFRASHSKEEVASYVANEIYVIKNRIKNTDNQERAEEHRAIGNCLIEYIIDNFEEEITSDHSELTRSYLRGC